MWLPLLAPALAAPPAPAPDADDALAWQRTIDRVTPSIVSIRMDRPRGFEGVGRGNSQATGFVVDAEQGLVLTNRHVVTGGPVRAEAVFQDNEVVDLVPVYRDPVHDFGLFRYDPEALRYTEPVSLRLAPEGAKVGVQIRVVGNDSGEQLSILDGTISRVDRNAPAYGGGYSDFDTFYVQAASATSGGSSGSPVLDVRGDVVALNAGSRTTSATAYYLPLERVVRAVEAVRRGEPVPRGTWLTRSEYTPFDELRRLGLTDELEDAARKQRPGAAGMLVVREVLPHGPADGKLEPGDLLLEVDGRPALDFVALEGALDGSVGRVVPVVVLRRGERVTTAVPVLDLHAASPSAMLEVAGGVLHDLSIHQARTAQIELDGVYLAEAGRPWTLGGLTEGALIREIDGLPVHHLADAAAALAGVPDGASFVVRWHPASSPTRGVESAVRMERDFWPARTCARDDATGAWPCEDLAPAPTAEAAPAPAVGLPPVRERLGRKLQPSIVGIRAEVPFSVAGLAGASYTGAGVVVDAERGWILVDRDTVPVGLSEVRVVLGGAVEVPATVVALHEVHDLAVVAVDPALLPEPLVAVELAADEPEERDGLTYVGLARDHDLVVQDVVVEGIDPVLLPADGSPRFRETNLDAVTLREPPRGGNGVLVDRKGRVHAFWASFSYNEDREQRAVWRGVLPDTVREVLALAAEDTSLRTLAWELSAVPLPRALERGLPPGEAERLVEHDPERRTVLQVLRVEQGDPLAQQVRPGDLLLAVGGRPVTRFAELDAALRGQDRATLLVSRGGRVESVEVATRPVRAWDVDRVVSWAGVRVHAPDRSARLLGVRPGLPYVAFLEGGSPAGRGKLYPVRSIVAVNGRPVADLDAFTREILAIPPGRPVRLDLVNKEGERDVVTVEPDERFFPTEELVWDGRSWERRALDRPAGAL